MTPNQTAVKAQAQNTAVATKLSTTPSPPQGDTSTLLDKFWKTVYSFQTPNTVANSIINTGAQVQATRDSIVSSAKTGLTLGLTLGPLLIVLAIGLYLYLMFVPKR